MQQSQHTHTTPSPAAPPLLVRGGEGLVPPLLFKEGWHAQHDGVVSRSQSFRTYLGSPLAHSRGRTLTAPQAMQQSQHTQTTPSPAAPPLLVRVGEGLVPPLLF